MINLLQVTDTIAPAAANATDLNKDGSISLGELLQLGGWIMIPLAVLFVATIYVFFERFLAIRRASRIEGNFMNIVRDHIITGNISAARSFTKNTNNPV